MLGSLRRSANAPEASRRGATNVTDAWGCEASTMYLIVG